MRLNEFESAEEQLSLLKLIMGNTLKSSAELHRAQVAQALRLKAANRGRIPTKREQPLKPHQAIAMPPKPQNVEPETRNIEAPVRPLHTPQIMAQKLS